MRLKGPEVEGKYERLIMLATSLIRLDVYQGHLRWKVTDLARSSRIARSLIYEYLGRNKNEMLMTALGLILDEVYDLAPQKRRFSDTHGNFKGLMRSRAIVMECPETLSFYYRNRTRTDEVGQLIRRKEKELLTGLRKTTGITDPVDLLFVRTMVHGLSTAPFLSDEEVSQLMYKLSALAKT